MKKQMVVVIHYDGTGKEDRDNLIEDTIAWDVAIMMNEKHEDVYEGTSRYTERRLQL